MGKEKPLLTAAIAAACLTVAGVAFGAQPVNKPVLHGNSCGNNGGGNGAETTSLGVEPPPGALCFKFVDADQDEPGAPGESCDGEIDPTCKP